MAIDCGIDIGSTNVKVVLVEESGQVVYARSVPTPRETDGIGSVTNAITLLALLEDMIIEGWQQCGGGKPLRSIATAGVGEDGLCVDSDLRPVGPAIPWFDRRPDSELSRLQGLGDHSGRTGIAIATDRTIAKWAWLRRHRPCELKEAAYWIALTDYPAVFWSGVPFMSVSLAPRTACFDLWERGWVQPLLEAVGAPPLSPVMPAGTAGGTMCRGRLMEAGAASSRTVVAAGGHDHPVAASVFRRLDATGLVDSLGTANLLYGEMPAGAQPELHPDLAFSIPPAGGPRLACLGVLELSAAVSVAQQQGSAFWSFLAHPHLPGEPPLTVHELGEVGVSPRGLRRALERVTLRARHLLASMHEVGVPQGPIYASGGWSRSRGFAELRASIFGQPLHVVDDLELTAIGAALYGAEAAGAAAAMPFRPSDVRIIDPVARWTSAYDRLFMTLREHAISEPSSLLTGTRH